MLGLSAYRLTERRTETTATYEFSDPTTGRLVAIARDEFPPPEKPGRFLRWQRALFDAESTRWLGCLVGVLSIPFLLLGMALGLVPVPPDRGKPRLVLKRPDVDEAILTVRQSSGMFYDSRVVYDGQGRAVTQFRGHSKIALGRMSFGMIDLGGTEEGVGDYGLLPWLGWVDPTGAGAFRFALVRDPGAGRVVRRHNSPSFAIEASPSLRDDPTGTLLLLATALALAWTPRP